MKRLLIILLVLLLSGCNMPDDGAYRSAVTRVYDGDTIKLANGEKVRYIGIDTPEMNYDNPPAEYLAREATVFNKRLVANKVVRLEFDVEKRDKYGRLLAYVFVEDTFVNAKMIEEGYATVFIIRPNVRYADRLLSLQRKARQEKKGLWAE